MRSTPIAVILISILFLYTGSFAQTETNNLKNQLLLDEHSDKILLPDVDLRIEDESEVPLKNQTDRLLKDSSPAFGEFDMDELSRIKVSDKFKAEMKEQRKREDFSLSAFKFYYGRYENFLADINIGKRAGDLNYLLSYLRNSHASLGHNTNSYFNTESEIDDLNLDLIYSVSPDLDLNAMFGYYKRDIGLYTNTANLSESKMNIPVRVGCLYNISMNSTLKAGASYNYLLLTHKLNAGYDNKTFWEAGADADFDANWSRDNYLKITGKYQYASYDNDYFHSTKIRFIDKFPILNFIAVQVGAEFDIYSHKSFFWYPILMAFYKYSDIVSLKFGVTGEQKNISIERYLNENQMDYRLANPEEQWNFLFSATYSPFRILKIKGGVSYHAYASLLNYQYVPAQELYCFNSETNTGIMEAEGGAELLIMDNLSVNGSYIFRLPFVTNMLFFYQHQVSLDVRYTLQDWGLEAGTRLSYLDWSMIQIGVYFVPVLIWNFEITKSVNKDVFLEIKLDNILNQPYFEKPDLPRGGFMFHGGVRILL